MVIDKLIERARLDSMTHWVEKKRFKPRQLINRLTEEEREELKQLKSEDLADVRPDLLADL